MTQGQAVAAAGGVELARGLQALAAQTCRDFEVLVIDQNGDDRLLPLLQEARQAGVTLRHVRFDRRSLSGARNHGLQLAAFSVVESSDHAVVRLIFNNADAARVVLRSHHYTFSEVDLLVVELSDGRSLTNLCLHLLGAELNIRFAYPVMLRREDSPTVAIAVDDLTLAGQILLRKRFRLLGEEDLA